MNRHSYTRTAVLALFLTLMSGVAGCSLPVNPAFFVSEPGESSPPDISPSLSTDGVRQTLPAPTSFATKSPTPGGTNTPTAAPSIQVPPCDVAVAGNPIDVSVPDDMQIGSGVAFMKTWRLVNQGSCTWTPGYAVVFFSGMDMAASREQTLPQSVAPGQTVDISIDMVSPRLTGSFQGNYKLRNEKGELFGIGPSGSSPFWVRIQVVDEETQSPVAYQPSETPTVAALLNFSASLHVDQNYDLETARQAEDTQGDMALRFNGNVLTLVPIQGAKVMLFGGKMPSVEDCRMANTSSEPLLLGKELEGSYLCVRTSTEGMARIFLAHVDPADQVLDIEFIIWPES